jgi:hypothetical protein
MRSIKLMANCRNKNYIAFKLNMESEEGKKAGSKV